MIFQSFNLLPALTVEENIVLSMEASGVSFDRPKHEIVLELLRKVRLPEEYAKERILHLSGGEQQRVAIARALSYGPRVVLADEPTGNLDMATQDDSMAIFRDLAHDEGKCVIIVTHSPAVVPLGSAGSGGLGCAGALGWPVGRLGDSWVFWDFLGRFLLSGRYPA